MSNYSLGRWRKADAALGQPVISNQVQFSLAHAGPLEDMVPFAERENRMVIAYSPLAQGLLGGKYSVDNRPGGVRMLNPLFGRENLQRAAPLLDTLRQVPRSTPSRRMWPWPGCSACPASWSSPARRAWSSSSAMSPPLSSSWTPAHARL